MNPHEHLIPVVELILAAANADKLSRVILSKPANKDIIKTVVTQRTVSGRRVLQAETFTRDGKAYHKNIDREDGEAVFDLCGGFSQINIFTSAKEAQFSLSKKGKALYSGIDAARRSLSVGDTVKVEGNNRKKNTVLCGDEEFLKVLGICDANGRIHDKKQSKFRQINKFLEYVSDCVPFLREEGTLRVLDLCCGKSYLSFALYHYLANILGREVSMTGVDLKADVIEYCSQCADTLGFSGLSFICGDINDFACEKADLTVSLHACDTATDAVLKVACDARSDVILSTPCCHHYVTERLSCPEADFIAKYPILRNKFADAATDALRLAYLEKRGYDVLAAELIDPSETPKNVLLRGIRKKGFDPDSGEAARLSERYDLLCTFLLKDTPYVI